MQPHRSHNPHSLASLFILWSSTWIWFAFFSLAPISIRCLKDEDQWIGGSQTTMRKWSEMSDGNSTSLDASKALHGVLSSYTSQIETAVAHWSAPCVVKAACITTCTCTHAYTHTHRYQTYPHRQFQSRASPGIAQVKFWSVVLIAYHYIVFQDDGTEPSDSKDNRPV